MSINIVIFSGNIGSNCIIRSTPNGKLIAIFSLPVKQGYGTYEKITWVQCRMFGSKVEKLSRFLTKGTKVIVTGQFIVESWISKNGMEKTTPIVIVNNLDFNTK